MTSVISTRGARKLVDVNNHIYTFSKKTTNGENDIWVCEKRGICKARVWTKAGDLNVTKVVTDHNHAAQAARPAALAVNQEIIEHAKSSDQSVQNILATSIQGLHENELILLPNKESLKRNIRRVKNQHGLPPLPLKLEDLVIPEEYRQILLNSELENFLLFDSGPAHDRMLIFSTNYNMQLLSENDEWFLDGTFSTVPKLFQQLYTIHVRKFERYVPVVYALLPNKTQTTYIKLFEQLKAIQPDVQPVKAMTDFETAAMQALQNVFPGIEKSGCFFQLCQCVWRRVQLEGLKQLYQQSHEFALWIRMIPALAFVPPQDVENAFEHLRDHGDFPLEATRVADYFEDTYIGRPGRRQRRGVFFNIPVWNMYERTINGEHRTNNLVEAWHREFQNIVGGHFPNIYNFINCLKKQQSLHQMEIVHEVGGCSTSRCNKRSRMSRTINERIKTIVDDYGQRNIIEYLRGIAHNFEF